MFGKLTLFGAALLGVPGIAAGQDLACAPGAEILRTDAVAARPVVNAPVRITVRLSDFADGTVSDITAQLDDGTEPVSVPAPEPGTVAGATLALPAFSGRAVLTVAWRQSAVEFSSVACRGTDVFAIDVGPSASEMRGYLARSARAQVQWLRHKKRYGAIYRRFDEAWPTGQPDVVAFPIIREAARRAGVEVRTLRPISRRYRALVLAAKPPDRLRDENADLAVTADRFDASVARYFADLSRAYVLADLTRANRESNARDKAWGRFRDAWREAVAKANRDAGVTPPRWATRVGR